MTEATVVTGMVLSAAPAGEFDRRVVLLTVEEGLVSAFARGARRPKSPLLAACMPMAFGTFDLRMGQSANTLLKAHITQHFPDVTTDYDRLCLGSYFLETAAWYGQTAFDERERLSLLYAALGALSRRQMTLRLIRMVYDAGTLAVNGEYPHVLSCVSCGRTNPLTHFHFSRRGMLCADCAASEPESEMTKVSASVLYTLQYMGGTPPQKLFSFMLDEETEEALWTLMSRYRLRYRDKVFRSEALLEDTLSES